MADLDEVKAEIEGPVTAGDFIQRLAERVGGTARASAVFGETIERDGVTVIPVARALWGFGGGGGVHEGEEGTGGGGGSAVWPIGYIEIHAGNASFRPFRGPRTLLFSAAFGSLAALAMHRAVRR